MKFNRPQFGCCSQLQWSGIINITVYRLTRSLVPIVNIVMFKVAIATVLLLSHWSYILREKHYPMQPQPTQPMDGHSNRCPISLRQIAPGSSTLTGGFKISWIDSRPLSLLLGCHADGEIPQSAADAEDDCRVGSRVVVMWDGLLQKPVSTGQLSQSDYQHERISDSSNTHHDTKSSDNEGSVV